MAYTYNGEIRPMFCEHCNREIVHREITNTIRRTRHFFEHDLTFRKYECKVCSTINKKYLASWDDEQKWTWEED
jgi:hypothetical protein